VLLSLAFARLLFLYITYEAGTDCSETPEHKIQTPGNNQKKEYNIHKTAESVNQEYFTSVGRKLQACSSTPDIPKLYSAEHQVLRRGIGNKNK
jgi:hypothetical protein